MSVVKKMENQKELETFDCTIAKIKSALEELVKLVDSRMEYMPEEITWSHVGSAQCVLVELEKVSDFAFRRGEYAS